MQQEASSIHSASAGEARKAGPDHRHRIKSTGGEHPGGGSVSRWANVAMHALHTSVAEPPDAEHCSVFCLEDEESQRKHVREDTRRMHEPCSPPHASNGDHEGGGGRRRPPGTTRWSGRAPFVSPTRPENESTYDDVRPLRLHTRLSCAQAHSFS